MAPLLPNAKLLTRAFQHAPYVMTSAAKGLSSASSRRAWEGKQPEENASREPDSHNVQNDAAKKGKAERADGEGSAATSEKDTHGSNKKAQRDHPEAPETVIGMNDERGGKAR